MTSPLRGAEGEREEYSVSEQPPITDTQKHWLGELFAAEVNSEFTNLPPIKQLPKRYGAQLVNKGLAEEVEATLPGRFPVRISGYVLTQLGHMTYCMSCTDEDE